MTHFLVELARTFVLGMYAGGDADLHGYIIDGELTPAPEPYVTE